MRPFPSPPGRQPPSTTVGSKLEAARLWGASAVVEGSGSPQREEASLGVGEYAPRMKGRPDFQGDEDRHETVGVAFRAGPAVLMAPPAPLAPIDAPPAAGSAAHAQAEIAAMADRMVTSFSMGRIGRGGRDGHAVRMSLALGKHGKVEVELELRGDDLTVSLCPDGPCAGEIADLSAALERHLGVEVTVR